MNSRAPAPWKRHAMNLIDALLLRLSLVSELVNQGLSKTLGWLAAFHLLSRTEVKGDYLEFGIFQGDSPQRDPRSSRPPAASPNIQRW